MEEKDKVQKLVYVYDLSKLNIQARLPELAKDLAVDDETLGKHIPSHEDRAASLAWDACYLQYLNTTPDGTLEHFDQNLNMEEYEKVTRKIQAMIPETVSFDELREVHRVQCLNLTRLDKKRQITDE